MEGEDTKVLLHVVMVIDGDDPEEAGRLAKVAHQAADAASGEGVDLADFNVRLLREIGPQLPPGFPGISDN